MLHNATNIGVSTSSFKQLAQEWVELNGKLSLEISWLKYQSEHRGSAEGLITLALNLMANGHGICDGENKVEHRPVVIMDKRTMECCLIEKEEDLVKYVYIELDKEWQASSIDSAVGKASRWRSRQSAIDIIFT
jgi:hypothetical protein